MPGIGYVINKCNFARQTMGEGEVHSKCDCERLHNVWRQHTTGLYYWNRRSAKYLPSTPCVGWSCWLIPVLKNLPAIGLPSNAPSPWNRRKSPKQLVSCSKPRYSTTRIDRSDAKQAAIKLSCYIFFSNQVFINKII